MQWHSVAEFFNMGGYAFYVWGSFGVTALVIAAEIWQVRAQRHHLLRNLFSDHESQADATPDSS
ncbi:MAG: heme exporter protein CcmD [Rhodoferax sp.]|nr:heme exporter protein CcmD [Rhodoferax sp.]